MSRIEKLFRQKKNNILNVYCTAGYPQLESTLSVMKSLQANGADMIELGMPYSDPLADGPVIQWSNSKAIENGMTIEKLFDQVNGFREHIQIPVLLMGYLNPVLQYGFEKFCLHAENAGIDGLIIPDLPMYEFETFYADTVKKCNLSFVFLVTPETPEDRVRKLDTLSTGFLYAVSSSSTTGQTKDIKSTEKYFRRLQNMKLSNPVLAGFGIRDNATFQSACAYTNGAIIGTAYIKALEHAEDLNVATSNFLRSIVTTN